MITVEFTQTFLGVPTGTKAAFGLQAYTSPKWIDRYRNWRHAPRADAVVYAGGGGWGDRIEWADMGLGTSFAEVFGWKDRKPRRGDVLLNRLESGRIGAFVFTHVRPVGDPRDMFHATVYRFGTAQVLEGA